MNFLKSIAMIVVALITITVASACGSKAESRREVADEEAGAASSGDTVFRSPDLIVQRLSPHSYLHVSYLQTEDFGEVPCNGVVVVAQDTALIFDTPANDSATSDLLTFLADSLHTTVQAVVVTHFHKDCVAGVDLMQQAHIPVWASARTAALLGQHGVNFQKPLKTFENELQLEVGVYSVEAVFCGSGHTQDNIVGYLDADKVLFGGCLVKEMGADKGNLADADTAAWPLTVQRVKTRFPAVQIVVPGHGDRGGPELLDYTMQLFK